jgi:hypothetical protein
MGMHEQEMGKCVRGKARGRPLVLSIIAPLLSASHSFPQWLLFFFALVLFFIAAGAMENGANRLMRAGAWGTYYLPSYPVTLTDIGKISASLYGVEGAPPAPSAAELMAAGFNDGDEGPMIVVNTVGDGYTYVNTPDQPWWQIPLWDINSCCSDSSNHFLSLMR